MKRHADIMDKNGNAALNGRCLFITQSDAERPERME